MLGELPNSFLKRHKGIGPGKRGGKLFVLLDQIDSLIGCLALVSLAWPWTHWVPSLKVWIVTLVLCSFVHMAFNGIFVLVGLKKSIF